MNLAAYTQGDLILPRLEASDAAMAIHELSRALLRAGKIADVLPFYQAALNRELLVGTDVEDGIALPHARLPGVRALAFALGRTASPITWRSSGVRTVRLVFLCAVPATDATGYLGLVSGLARLTSQERWLEELHAAPDCIGILDILRRVPIPASPTETSGRAASSSLRG